MEKVFLCWQRMHKKEIYIKWENLEVEVKKNSGKCKETVMGESGQMETGNKIDCSQSPIFP